MPGGGTLRVTTSPEDESHILMKFQDTGTGISEEDLKKIYNPFFSTKKQGTGLGLSISREIVNAHEGQIRVESQPGEGTTVIVILPVRASGWE